VTQLTEEAKRLLELAKKATPGPWFVVGPPWNDVGAPWINAESEDPHGGVFVCDLDSPADNHSVEEWERVEASADFIAAARELAPALADAYLAQERVTEAAVTAHKFAADVMLFASDARAPVAVDWLVVSAAAGRVKDELAAALAAVSVGSPETGRTAAAAASSLEEE
jgi:hypothetical protein